tara:strand:- start:1512 stop:3761 length:2250 start_codon:yes stop_codon:yes gene_type:complete
MFSSNKFFQVISGFLAFGFTILQGIDWLFQKYSIDNKWFNYIIIGLIAAFIASLFFLFIKSRQPESQKPKSNDKKSKFIKVANVVFTGLLLILFVYFFRKSESKNELLTELLPKISIAYDNNNINYVFKKSKELLAEYPENQILKSFFIKSSWKINVDSDIDKTDVYVKYGGDSIWNYIGKTPIDSLRVPGLGYWDDFNLKLINGKTEYIGSKGEYGFFNISLIEKLPDGFVLKKSKEDVFMNMPGVYFGSNIKIDAFGVSKKEVSNYEFKTFIESGGYENPDYWDFPIIINGHEYSFDEAKSLFTDRYGKSGPKNWSYGEYPDGEGEFPVNGVSWFEARAYAKYKSLDLPNIYQWLDAALLSGFTSKLPELKNSNYNSTKLKNVKFQSANLNLLPNIAGNVREWVINPHGSDRRSILGGAFNANEYTFNSFYSLNPLDRSVQNGFRLVKNFDNENEENNNFNIRHIERNFDDEIGVSDEVFEVYKSQFDYPKAPLKVKTSELKSPNPNYSIEKFEMDTPYNSDEKLYGFIISSKEFKNKSVPIIEFPTAGAIFSDKFIIDENLLKERKYILDEGYSLIIPVYYNNYDREKPLKDWWPNESEEYKNAIIKIGKDFKRVIDYLETREDLEIKKLSYLGYSWGSVTSNILLAIDERVKSAAIFIGGLMLQKSRKEIEAHIYLRRIKIPILHIVGKLDGIFEYEDSFLPWNKLIGTPEEDKFIIAVDNAGHGDGISKNIIINNHLELLKKYN